MIAARPVPALAGCILLAMAMAAGPARAQSGLFVYAPNVVSDTVSAYTTGSSGALTPVSTTIGTLGGLYGAVRGDQAFAYLPDQNGDQIRVVDTATQAIVQSIGSGGSGPVGLAISRDGTTLYVANLSGGGAVGVFSVNATTGLLTQTATIGGLNVPRNIALSPDGTRAWVSEHGISQVAVIDTATNSVIATVGVGVNPMDIAVSPDGTRVYVSSNNSNNLSVINAATSTVVANVPLTGPTGIAVSADGRYIYVAQDGPNQIAQIDTSTNAVVATFATGNDPIGVAISPDGTTLYAAASGSNNIGAFSINAGTGALTPVAGSPFAAGNFPYGVAMCGNGNAMLGGGSTFVASSNGALGCAGSSATLTGGTVLVAASNLTMATPITLAAEGGTFDTNGNNLTLSGAIGGTGSFTKTGLGTLTLGSSSTYSGATLVNMGTLQAGVADAFSANSAYTLASGATLALAGFNQTIGSLSGAGLVSLGTATLTTGNDNTSTTFSGAISGAGGLTKIGTGTLTLNGSSSYTGPTTVNAGGLIVNGNLASTVTVNAGAMLGGSGTLGGLAVVAGTVAPGNSIGTLTVNGNFSQSGGVYQVEVNAAGQSDRINATGTATIGGGATVQAIAAQGNYARNTTYTILTADGGVSGAYSGVSSNFAFLVPSLSYEANNVFLTLTQTATAFASGAQTSNQFAVGTVLDATSGMASGDYLTVIDALSVLSTAQGPAALNTISGQQYADFGTTNVNTSAMFMNTLGQQMALARGASSGGQRVALAMACEIEACDNARPLSAWFSGLGGLGSVQGNSNASTLTYNFGGAAAGIDYRLTPNILLGLGVGYTHGTQWVNSFTGQGWSDSVSVAAYGSFTQAGFYADALAGYAYFNNQMQRQIQIPGLQPRTASGSTGANQFLTQIETGYGLPVFGEKLTATPFARLQFSTTTQNAFNESGAQSLSLNVAQQTTNSLRTVFGAELASNLPLGTERQLGLALRLGWQHEYADTGRPITAAFSGAPSASFTVYGATPTRDAAIVGFSANTTVMEATQLYLRYDGTLASGTDNHAFTAGLRLSW